jgi:AcrR family transcriptional regulator
MAAVIQRNGDKAERILAVTRDLLLKRGVRGVTVAEIAERAHVGKGTVYLYWDTKEELFFCLLARDFLSALDEFTALVQRDPDVMRPRRLVPLIVRSCLDHPFVRAVHAGDVDTLGLLTEHPLTKELLATAGTGQTMHKLLPLWRRYNLARTDWDLADQIFALQAIIAGFFALDSGLLPKPEGAVDDSAGILAATTRALIEPDNPTDEVGPAATEALAMHAETRSIVVALLDGKGARDRGRPDSTASRDRRDRPPADEPGLRHRDAGDAALGAGPDDRLHRTADDRR